MNTYNTYAKGPKAGQPKTLTDRVVRFLVEGLNRKELPSKNKYRKFEPTTYYGILKSWFWVGKNGAVRAGKNISNSVSLTSHIHVNMRLWERKEGL